MNKLIVLTTIVTVLLLLSGCSSEDISSQYQQSYAQADSTNQCTQYGRTKTITYSTDGQTFKQLCITKSPYTEKHVSIP